MYDSGSMPRVLTPAPSSLWWSLGLEDTLKGADGVKQRSSSQMTAIEFFLATQAAGGKEFNKKQRELDADLHAWLRGDTRRGVIRMYRDDESTSKLVQCVPTTTADVLAKTFACDAIYVQMSSDLVRKLNPTESPLNIQNDLLWKLGYTENKRVQNEGKVSETGNYVKFYAGAPLIPDIEERLHLKGTFKVKMQSGCMQRWSFRYCVLCGSKLLVFSSGVGLGRPQAYNLYKGTVQEYKIQTSGVLENAMLLHSTIQNISIIITFTSWTQYSSWLKKARKMTYRRQDELNLSSCCIETLPDHLFIHWNKHVHNLNLTRNFMKERDAMKYDEYDTNEKIGTSNHDEMHHNSNTKTMGFIDDLRKFSHLSFLTLSDNEFNEFPLSICNISTLRELNLSRNNLRSIPRDIQKLKKLEVISLHTNSISRLPQQLANLHRLIIINLSFNKFQLFPRVLLEVSSIQSLIFSGNRLTSLPTDINLISSLRKLDLRLNPISTLPYQSLKLLKYLTEMNITQLAFEQLTTESLTNLVKLTCNSTALHSVTISNKKLVELSITNGRLLYLKMSSACSRLVSIDVSKNALKELPEELCDMPCLREIVARRNFLTRLPARIFWNMNSLIKLNVAVNQIKTLPDRIDKSSLIELDLSSNHLVYLPIALLLRLSELTSLNISSNRLLELPITSKSKEHQNLRFLSLANNKLTESALAVIASYNTLTHLNIAYNNFSSIADQFMEKLTDLEYLNISGNNLSHLPASLTRCLKLQTLYTHSNRLTSLPDLSTCRSLRELDIAFNLLKELPVNADLYFNRLRYLDLSGNGALNLADSSIAILRNIKRLVVEGIMEVPMMLSSMMRPCSVDCSLSVPYHHQWTHGSAEGRNLNKLPITTNITTNTTITTTATTAEKNTVKSPSIPVDEYSDDKDDEYLDYDDANIDLFLLQDSQYNNYLQPEEDNVFIQQQQQPYTICQIKEAGFRRGKDGLFAIAEGMPTCEVANDICIKLPQILSAELEADPGTSSSGYYLKYALLAANKLLDRIGQYSAASIAVCHIMQVPGGLVLNTANIGTVEAVLCRDGKPITLTQLHTTSKNVRERHRVLDSRGFITEDNKVQGLYHSTRALGGFTLYPIVIPEPSLNSHKLTNQDEFLIIGSHGLWDYVTYDQAVKEVKPLVDYPIQAAKRLRDLAIAHGCKDNLATLVVNFSLIPINLGMAGLGSATAFGSEAYGMRRSGKWKSLKKVEGIEELGLI